MYRVRLHKAVRIHGVRQEAGTTVDVSDELYAELQAHNAVDYAEEVEEKPKRASKAASKKPEAEAGE